MKENHFSNELSSYAMRAKKISIQATTHHYVKQVSEQCASALPSLSKKKKSTDDFLIVSFYSWIY